MEYEYKPDKERRIELENIASTCQMTLKATLTTINEKKEWHSELRCIENS